MTDERDDSLSLAFMRGHPQQAARVLEALPENEAAQLFVRAPARLGAGVLAAMLPMKAARCLGALSHERALELLAPMGAQPTVAVLRHLPDARRRALIGELPTVAALASRLLLGYTEESVGAWADPDVVTLPVETRAGEALERMRQAPGDHPVVFVLDRERRLAGVVAVATLLQAPAGATLTTLMQRPAAVLAAHAPLSSASEHPGWEQGSAMPVVEPGERLVGVLTRDALARALRRVTPPDAVGREESLALVFARSYWQALSGLFAGFLTLLPRVSALEDNRDER